MAEDLWLEASSSVPVQWQHQLSGLLDSCCGPEALLTIVIEEKERCRREQWKCRGPNGRKVYVRDIFQRVTFWLDKLKAVGDVLFSYDQAHTALPWAGARFLLQAVTTDIKQYGAMLEAVEVIVSVISRYYLIERIYLSQSASYSYGQLRESIVKVYKEILVFLCTAKKYFSQNTAKRFLLSFGQLGNDFDTLLKEVQARDMSMEKLRPLLDAEVSQSILLELGETGIDIDKMRNALTDLEYSMKGMCSTVLEIQDGMQRDERRKITKWLSNEPYPEHHKRISSHRLPGSGTWLFSRQEYKTWRNSSLCSVLWLHARPGAGKSVLTSHVIDAISQELENQPDPLPLAYFYCTRESSEPNRSNPTEVLCSILKQLSCKYPGGAMFQSVITKWRERLDLGTEHRLDLNECIDIIVEITSTTGAIIIIDALDELQESTRGQLLDGLNTITQESDRQVHIFVSSRENWDIKFHFREIPKLEITPGDNSHDISNYVVFELNNRIKSGKLLSGHPPDELVEQIKESIISKADGIFRWASASIQTLCDPKMLHPEDVRLALRQLPIELDGVYSIIVGQIHNGSAWSMPLAKKALRWMLHTQQALGSQEFIKALSADSDASESSVTVDLLLNVCCNLVMYDSELDVVRFVHLSVREYLEQGQEEYEMCLSHASIAVACLQGCLHGSKPKRKVQLRNSQNKTFYDYAMVYWPLHCRYAGKYRLDGPLSKVFMRFLYDGKRPSRHYREWQSLNWSDSWEEMELRGIDIYDLNYPLRERILDGQSAWWDIIFLACSFGFLEILKSSDRFSERDIRRSNRSGRDPFTVAVRHGEGEVVEHLASMASGVGESDEASLIAAITMSRAPLIQYLLENNEKLEITEDILRMAMRTADIATIKLILEHERCEKPDITTELLTYAAANETSGKDAINLLMDLDEFLEIDEYVVITACKNQNQGLKIMERLFAYQENTPISEDAAEAAASNSTCGWGLLNFLFKRAPDLPVTDFMFESAAGCFSAEPIRFLLAQSTSASPKYHCLCIAAENVEVGDEIMELLLPRCDSALLDSSLLLLVLENRKRATTLLRLLLAKTADSPIQITIEALVLACKNKYGQELMEELLPRYLPTTIDLRVALTAVANQYSPVELLTLLSQRDESLVLSTDVAIEAAKSAQYALELLLYIQQHKHDVFTILEVVESYAANWTSGIEIIQYAKDTGCLIASSKALEFAAQNGRNGDKIIGQWLRNKIHVEITPKAVENAMSNHHGLDILRLFLRMDGNVQVSQGGFEVAARNMTVGRQLLKMIIKRQGIPKDLESVVWFATQNRENGIEVIEVLSSAAPLCLTASGLEAALAFRSIETNERINHLLRDQNIEMVVTNDAVRWAMEMEDCLPTLSLLLRRKPDLQITTDSVRFAIKECRSIASLGELFEFFTRIGRPIEVTETIVKACFTGGVSYLKIIDFLEQYCRQTQSSLPVTTELLYIIVNARRWDPKRFEILERLLKIATKDGKSALSINKDIVKLALPDRQAKTFFAMMKKYNHPVPDSLRSDPDCISLGVANLYLKDNVVQEIFGIDAKARRTLRGTESGLITMFKITDSIRDLKAALLALDDPLPITPKVLKATIQRTSWPDQHVALLVRLLIKQQPSRVPELINEEVLLALFSTRPWLPTQMLKLLFRIRRQFNAPIPISSRLIDLSARTDFLTCQLLMRELSNEKGIESLRALVSPHTVKQAIGCYRSSNTLRELKNIIGREHLVSLLDENALMIVPLVSVSWYNIEAISKAVTPLHSLDFYEDIAELLRVSSRGNLIRLRSLLAKGTFPNAQDGTGMTTLSKACFRDFLSVVKELVKHPSVDLNIADWEGMTALMIAAKADSAEIVRELLEHGADKTLLNNEGRTAEDTARFAGHYALATYIRDFGNTSADLAIAEVGLPERFPASPFTLLTRTTM